MKRLHLGIMSLLYILLFVGTSYWNYVERLSSYDVYTFGLNLFTLLLLGITFTVLCLDTTEDSPSDKCFSNLFIYNFYAIFLHTILMITNGYATWRHYTLVEAAFYNGLKTLELHLFVCYVHSKAKQSTKTMRYQKCSLIALCLAVLISFSSIFLPGMYQIAEGGTIQLRFNLFFYLFVLCQVVIYLCFMGVQQNPNEKTLLGQRGKKLLGLLTGSIFFLQYFLSNIEFIQHLFAVNLIILFILNFSKKGIEIAKTQEALSEQEWQSQQLKQRVLLGRIQPGFIFDTLSTIAHLTKMDQEMAYQTTVTFADYLRNNLDTLSHPGIIPFKKELEYIKGFVDIKRLSYRDKLQVTYDIETLDFGVPALTIVPFIELAITKGLAEIVGGVFVQLLTREKEDCFLIVIQDDGIGFDLKNALPEEESLILQNVQQRLEQECKGGYQVESSPDKGTTVTVTIRKEAHK